MDRRTTNQAPSVQEYLNAIRHRWPLVLGIALLFAGLTFGLLGRGGPVFDASAEVLVRSNEAQTTFETNAAANRNQLANEVRFANALQLRAAVVETLGLEIPPEQLKVEVSTTAGADLLVFDAIATDPDKAALLANTYANIYVQERRLRAENSYTGGITALEDQVTDTRARRAELQQEADSLRVQLAGLGIDSPSRASLEAKLAQEEARIAPTLSAIETEEATLLNLLATLRVSKELAKTGTAEVISEAFPGQARGSRKLSSLIIGTILGLTLGSVAAVTWERVGDRIRTVRDLERAFPNIPILGSLPTTSLAKVGSPEILARPTGPFTEALLQIRTSVKFMAQGRPISLITVTSSKGGEGKTTLSTNLAWSMGAMFDHVVLFDVDLRRPQVQSHFPIENTAGTTEFLTEQGHLRDLLHRFQEQGDAFSVVTAGEKVSNPADLLGSSKTVQMIRAVSAEATVVLDAAPVLPVSDSRVLAGASDMTIIVVRVGKTNVSEVTETVSRIRLSGDAQLAFVLNGTKSDASPYVDGSSRWFSLRRRNRKSKKSEHRLPTYGQSATTRLESSQPVKEPKTSIDASAVSAPATVKESSPTVSTSARKQPATASDQIKKPISKPIAEPKQARAKQAEPKPAESKPAESKPVKSEQADAKPANNQKSTEPANNKSVTKKAEADKTDSDKTNTEELASDKTDTEELVSDTTSGRESADSEPSANKTEANNTDSNKPDGAKPSADKPVRKKSTGNNTGRNKPRRSKTQGQRSKSNRNRRR